MKIIIEPENGPAQVWSTEPAENRATLYENRAKDLEKQLAEEKDRADAWELRCEELEQELRDAQDRIHEQDWTIGQYDEENRELREQLRKCGDKPFPISLNEWAERIHENAVDHGWWTGVVHTPDFSSIRDDVDRPLPEILMLCVCELAESMEEYRDRKPLIYEGENGKPEGIAVEMVDCIIRILDWMGHNGVDVDDLIKKKHAYNLGRPYRHGGKQA